MKLAILSGWSNPGGSTRAHINLCNLFNEKGLDCTFYGLHQWHLDKCKAASIHEWKPGNDDQVIFHFLPHLPVLDNAIYSCHETNLTNLDWVKNNGIYSGPKLKAVHFVSDFQKEWHGDLWNTKVEVIPNVLPDLHPNTKRKTSNNVAGVIGSIDPHKRTHLAIQRALSSGYRTVLLYGNIIDRDYYQSKVAPYLLDKENDVIHMGHVDDIQEMYDRLDAVFHSSERETFNYIQAECELTGTKYFGLPENNPEAEYWDKNKVFKAWMKLLEA